MSPLRLAFYRIVAAFAVILSLLVAPTAPAGKIACATAPADACGGCCSFMECCDTSADTAPKPAPVPTAQHETLQALIAISGSNRPLVAILAPRNAEFPPLARVLPGRSSDPFALLCTFLI